MRYIRFLKLPRIVDGKNPAKAHIFCLISITSDLGDSFLPYDVQLFTELCSEKGDGKFFIQKTVQWTAVMRSLPIRIPLGGSQVVWPAVIRVGIEPSLSSDDFMKLCDKGSRGVVSAWSAPISPSGGTRDAAKLVERRFALSAQNKMFILEETGESIARHLWDAGIALSCYLGGLIDTPKETPLAKIFQSPKDKRRLQILELGTGCGMVGISLAQIIERADIITSDLPEAEEIFKLNMSKAILGTGSTMKFRTIDWEESLPDLRIGSPSCAHCTQFDVIVAADCTYNPDSSPALVKTISRLTECSPAAAVILAMKVRHSSESIIFDLMLEAGFIIETTSCLPLPGDDELGEENVEVFIFRRNSKS
ncbi:uncharacterized protein BDR25DRAFT_255297 [Lindgomyces ingoldianus]|uniref:Uncharacterized protein n=1 Tax=Lindgomyces ingoldianus TaxID=673940 RepID=A0ACB6R6E2_9PLEO|nr:uncharacterized protein BDR25DRAFT_255297 [Lindgomyces ingoldianus]KAF2474823.1 hypothetical protein BDR25DRAFT_255297 [Lindgomyces ingoldianus]